MTDETTDTAASQPDAARRPFPRATYRLQLHAGFGFADAAARAPYLAALGISHVYLSPIFAARPGSLHGYDGIDHNRLNPELGSETEFRAMLAAFRENGLGTILDFVPNHMGIGGANNEYWLSVLEWGAESPHAARFDIDWNAPFPGLAGKVLFPFLGASVGTLLEEGGLRLGFDAETGSFAIWAHDTHKLPVCPRSYGDILADEPRIAVLAQGIEAAGPVAADQPVWSELKRQIARAAREDPPSRAAIDAALARHDPDSETGRARLAALIAAQHWRAAKFSLDGDAINYRRFFTISDLAALRIEDPAIFDEIHRLVLQLLADGDIDGIRIDHIDGLADPRAYTLRLREKAARPFYLLVEKILAPDEDLPAAWETDGTTGYEVANLLIGLLVNPEADEDFTRLYEDFTGLAYAPEAVVRAGKHAILAGPMAAELEALTRRFHALAVADRHSQDIGPHMLRRGLAEVIAAFGVYRSYADAEGLPPEDRPRIAAAVAAARAALPGLEATTFDLIASVLSLDLAAARPEAADAILAAARGFQQLSGPVMAKGLEDTALYRSNRLIALNEVGSEPGAHAVAIAAFHAANAKRLAREPRALLTTSTHDTKRGEDARVRIAALSYHRAAWEQQIGDWHRMLHDETAPVDPNEEYFFYQLLIGSWPMEWRRDTRIPPAALAEFRDRVSEAMLKSIREASVNTRWVQGAAAYEDAMRALIARALTEVEANRFLPAFRGFEARIAPEAAFLALAQTVLKLTIPGVPDIYQGAELWDQSHVDPDNRRPVDFALRARLLVRPAPAPGEPDLHGDRKLAAIAALLGFRREEPRLFAAGSYEPIAAEASATSRVVAFRRATPEAELLVAISLPPRSAPPDLGALLAGAAAATRFRDLLTGGTLPHQDLAPALAGRNIVVLAAQP